MTKMRDRLRGWLEIVVAAILVCSVVAALARPYVDTRIDSRIDAKMDPVVERLDRVVKTIEWQTFAIVEGMNDSTINKINDKFLAMRKGIVK